MSHALLNVTNLVKTFEKASWVPYKPAQSFTAVNAISFELQKGEILGLLGPNGAGKTTTIHMLLSILTPTSGSITYFGKDFFTHRSEILQQVAFASTYVKLPPRLTVYENLNIYGRLYGLSYRDRTESIEKHLKFFGMWNVKDKETGVLSAGQITRVMLAKAFLARPKIVLLDEPTASLDPDIAHEVRHFIVQQQQDYGVSLLVTSHNMDEVTQICNRVLVLKKGMIIANNTPENLAASVANARVHLITATMQELMNYAQKNNIIYTHQKNTITLEIDEHAIAPFLCSLARENIVYSQISIDKPSLEDYFLSLK